MDNRQGTYIAYDANGVKDHVNSNLHNHKMLEDWQRMNPGRFNFINIEDIHLSSSNEILQETTTTLKHHLERQMAKADNMLVVVSPVLNPDSPILNWQISRGVNHFHLPIVIAYAGLDRIDDHTIQTYWEWLPAKFRKYLTQYPWARMAHVPLVRDKVQRALATYSAGKQVYPWDGTTIF